MFSAKGFNPTANLPHVSIVVMRLNRNSWRTGKVLLLILAWNTVWSLQQMLGGEGHWVTTWGCGPQLTEPGNLPPAPLANSTLRQFVRVTIGGNHLRVRFSN